MVSFHFYLVYDVILVIELDLVCSLTSICLSQHAVELVGGICLIFTEGNLMCFSTIYNTQCLLLCKFEYKFPMFDKFFLRLLFLTDCFINLN